MTNGKVYRLAIKRGNKDYLPLEWELSSSYNGENLTSLEGIDSFTTKTDLSELFSDMVSKSILDPEERFQDISIIFYEKGNIREVPHGPIFKEFDGIVNTETIKSFILENKDNKQLMNKVFNSLNKYQGIKPIDQIRLVLNNLELFSSKGDKYLSVALDSLNEVDYEIIRNIVLYIELTLKPELNETQKKVYKNNNKKDA